MVIFDICVNLPLGYSNGLVVLGVEVWDDEFWQDTAGVSPPVKWRYPE